ncbi:glycosyltransferase family 2 protein [Granulicoccus phenolivorans]|uniref:glycosyltransferase family 2 protein n=1 Tax=Granulicoccus phenolivorans TaxID=266854 RepID=UPI000478D447|nr:glycosyltransferase family 2 protein [Granulicoccus phenolivorans]
MTVDVLFPYYGDVALMKLAVHSVLKQEYTDFRLVVVDDGYPDDSIPGWFASLNDPRVSYQRNEKNLGANGNYRKALSLVENELVIVMGADDVMMPNYLQWLVDRAAEFPEAQIFQPGVFVIDQHGAPAHGLVEQIKDRARPKGHGPRLLSGEKLAASLLGSNWLYFPSIAWRAEAITKHNFRPEYNVVQDLALALDIIMDGGSLLLDDYACFQYRRHSGSDSSVKALEGTRFAEERAFFTQMAKEMDAKGWKRAAAVARAHLSSRLHAGFLLPRAALNKKWSGVKNLATHVVR